MKSEQKSFLYELLTTPSPTGHESAIQSLVADRLGGHAERVRSDFNGNLFLETNSDAQRTVLLTAHCDQIGFIVTRIDKQGYLSVESLGGIDEGSVQGANVVVHSASGPVEGVFGKRATHLQSKDEKSHVPIVRDMWVDIGAHDRTEAEAHVALGDYVTYRLGVTPLLDNLISAAGIDNKVGLFVALEVFKQCCEADLTFGLCAVSTVQEEVGLRGASTAGFQIAPEVGIAVDVVHASDHPGRAPKMVSCQLGKGPTIPVGPSSHPVVGNMLMQIARRESIPYQVLPKGKLAGNESKALQTADGGIAAIGIGIPNRNMHTQVEVSSLVDIENTIRLLAAFIRSLDEQCDFRPVKFDRSVEEPARS